MNSASSQTKVLNFSVDSNYAGQRIDNFLFTRLKGVPKTRIYRALRKGEVRVNKKRVKPDYRLQAEDLIRLPPLRQAEKVVISPSEHNLALVEQSIIYEDKGLLIVNKPAGMAVHGGSGVHYGVIEAVRKLKPHSEAYELVHRLDRDTSGCLLIAKKRSVLKELHLLLAERQMEKIYLTLVKGRWQGDKRKVELKLLKSEQQSGERIVRVHEQGKIAVSEFRPLRRFSNTTLMEVKILTGRTHQIRVHAASIGHPVVGDDKYGDWEFNKEMRKWGSKRLFLHAASVRFQLEVTEQKIAICACMDSDLLEVLKKLD